jgi:hypothetical protein
MSPNGSTQTFTKVRSSVALGGKADFVSRTERDQN